MNELPGFIQPGDRVLVSVDNYFFAPDGRQYRAVYGTIRAPHTAEVSLGIRPNGKSTNWYLEIGNMLIAGCQIHYLVKSDSVDFGTTESWSVHEGVAKSTVVPTYIYNADESLK